MTRGEDIRSIANKLLSISDGRHRLSNLTMQKIVYFLHGQYLTSTGTPLVSGYFEAWEYGPVHPTLYASLSHLGRSPFVLPLKLRSVTTGTWADPPAVDPNIAAFLEEQGPALMAMSPGRLVELSHAKNSPWDVVTWHGSRRTWGARLDNDLIRRHYRFHKRSVGEPADGEDFEEHPPTRD